MKIISYLKSVPERNSNKTKTDLLINYAEGAKKLGDESQVLAIQNWQPSDVAVIQGWVYDNISTSHLRLRSEIIKNQLANNRFVCIADANLFGFVPNKKDLFLRYSFNGVFPSTGIYCDDTVDPNRWNKIKNTINIDIEPIKKGKTVLLCVQRNGGWSMKGLSNIDWILSTVKKLRMHTDRKIVVRSHPGDKRAKEWLKAPQLRELDQLNAVISPIGTPLENDLFKCHAVVNHNSSSIVGPIIKGHHAFITDPKDSHCAEVANTDLSLIENPNLFDRQKWLERISMFHWSLGELSSGKCWKHMRQYCS
jgi:hypothetical protein